MRILSALGAREVPALVLDCHGQFADPHSPFVRAANPVVLDAAQGLHSGGLLATIRKGLVIDLHNLYAETVQLAAGAFVLRKLYRDMFHWGPAEGLRLVLALDETHRLARDTTLPKIMKEGRKFGIAVIVASRGLSDFHQDVLGNAGTKVIFRTNYPESRRIAGYIRARPGQDVAARIEQLPVGSAYVQTPEMTYGVVVRMYPLDAGV
jgi:DNA helicase HerA-like ATPase